MGTGNFISSLHLAFLPPRSPSAAFVPVGLGALLRRVAGWGPHLLLSRKHRGAGVLSSPATLVVPRLPPASRAGSATTAVSRFRPCQRCVPPRAHRQLLFAQTPLLFCTPSALCSHPPCSCHHLRLTRRSTPLLSVAGRCAIKPHSAG